jgi:hypothetical protein
MFAPDRIVCDATHGGASCIVHPCFRFLPRLFHSTTYDLETGTTKAFDTAYNGLNKYLERWSLCSLDNFPLPSCNGLSFYREGCPPFGCNYIG